MGSESSSVDPRSGYCTATKTFHNLRPPVPLPPSEQPLSITQHAFSLLRSTVNNPTTTTNSYDAVFLVDSSTGDQLTFSTFIRQLSSLAVSLQKHYSFARNDVAFILCPSSLRVPVVYFALLALGVTISPANPLGSDSEVAHQVNLSRPAVAFATGQTAHKLPSALPKILIDSPEFDSFLTQHPNVDISSISDRVAVSQFDTAAILYSSGTTGRVKGVALSHRNMIALISGMHYIRPENPYPNTHPVSLFTLPLFHVYGFLVIVRAVAMGGTLVLMRRFDFVEMLRAVEKYKVRFMPVSPPLIVALAKSDLTKRFDLSSLLLLGCGGAPAR